MIRTRSFVATALALLVPSLVAVPTGGQVVPPGGPGFSAAAAATALYAGGMPGPAGPLAVRAGFSAAAVDASGLVAETRQLPAAVQVLAGTPEETRIEVLGETVLRARADGRPGGAGVDYTPAAGAGPTSPFLRITRGSDVTQLTTQEVFGPDGLSLDLSPLVEVHIGGATRGPGGGPTVAADGTEAVAVADLIRLTVLPNNPGGGA